MTYFLRLFAILILSSGAAFAAGTAPTKIYKAGEGANLATGASAMAACSASWDLAVINTNAANPQNAPYWGSVTGAQNGTCSTMGGNKWTTVPALWEFPYSEELICPNGQPPGASGLCEAPASANNNCTLPGVTGAPSVWMTGRGGTGPKSICEIPPASTGAGGMSGDPALPGCRMVGTSNIATGSGNPDAPDWQWGASMRYSGEKCDPSQSSGNGSSAPTTCPPGQFPGQGPSGLVCYTPSNTDPKQTTATGSTSTTTPDGNTQKTDTTKSTTCTATTCTTTTTITNTTIGGGGGGGTSGTVPTPQTTTVTTTCTRNTPGCGSVATTPTTSTTTTSTTPTTSTTTTTNTPTGSTSTTSTGGTTSSSTTVGAGGGNGNGNGDTASFCAENPNSAMCAPIGAANGGTLSDRPTLYERKYPDGMSGVWQARSAQFNSSPLLQLTSGLQPTIVGSGGYPEWTVNLSLGKWNFGTYPVSPPPMVWDFLKVCVILSAMFLARALIFGG